MQELTKVRILQHAWGTFPRECCGLLCVKNGEEIYEPCENISPFSGAFTISPRDYARVASSSSIIAIVHSHCNEPPIPSMPDLVGCETTGLPWHIVSIPTETWHSWNPSSYKAPLIGRPYSFGTLDCYSLVKDWYQENRPGVFLPPRSEREWKCWESSDNFFLEGFKELGFNLVEDNSMVEGDIILMQMASKVVDHIGVFLSPNILLHHLAKCLSTRDVFGGQYRKNTRHVLRYGGLS